MGSRASGVQRDSGTPRSEGEARAELTQNVPNSSYEGKKKKKTEKSLEQESPVSAGQAVSSRCWPPSHRCRVPLSARFK